MSDDTPAAPNTCWTCGAAASATLQLEKCSGDCRSSKYCYGCDRHAQHSAEHAELRKLINGCEGWFCSHPECETDCETTHRAEHDWMCEEIKEGRIRDILWEFQGR